MRALPEGIDWELFEERAAIIEYDGGYSRPTAERMAREEVARIAERKRLQGSGTHEV